MREIKNGAGCAAANFRHVNIEMKCRWEGIVEVGRAVKYESLASRISVPERDQLNLNTT